MFYVGGAGYKSNCNPNEFLPSKVMMFVENVSRLELNHEKLVKGTSITRALSRGNTSHTACKRSTLLQPNCMYTCGTVQ